MKKKDIDKARLVCERELTLLRESLTETNALLESSKSDIDEQARLTGVKNDIVSNINKYEKILEEVNFVTNALYENTPLPSNTKLGDIINEYKSYLKRWNLIELILLVR
ncbi:hypothetical protein [Metaclostridioides mangenotii]|uniref:hypothetical protein n=1 Tax=Metaclostridioides mangenotii TaxID=1540 RepID=UPI000466E190|nr:hypothetical protein [Clostridioides mangenotii]